MIRWWGVMDPFRPSRAGRETEPWQKQGVYPERFLCECSGSIAGWTEYLRRYVVSSGHLQPGRPIQATSHAMLLRDVDGR